MDPWLENPDWWQGVHTRVITFMASELNSILPGRYVATVEDRLEVVPAKPATHPDIGIRRTDPSGTGSTLMAPATAASRADTPLVVDLEPEEPPEHYLDIIDVTERDRIVATIEVLSPSNKDRGTLSHNQYRAKQRDMIGSRVHFLEIDLLRAGAHTVSVPLGAFNEERLPDYIACLHRGGTSKRFWVWPATVRERLPRVAVPLDSDVEDVVLDLQPVLDRTYDEGRYVARIDYSRPPEPPLNPEDAEWADALLKERRFR